jgi:hypothetical protein
MQPQVERRNPANAAHRAAIDRAKAAPTEHQPRLVTNRHVQESMERPGAIGRFNTWLAVVITKSVGTMWCAYVFAVIGITSLVGVLTQNTLLALIAGSISSYFLQLVLLPIIIVGQNVISAAQDARAFADHETLVALHTINVRQLKLLEQQEKILTLLEQRAP